MEKISWTDICAQIDDKVNERRRQTITKTRIDNSAYSCLTIHWSECDDGMGWHGKCQLWNDENNTKVNCKREHTVNLRQTMPLGGISVTFDECDGGVWKMANFEGHTLTERDLEWAACWAVLALEDKHKRAPAFCKYKQ